MVKNYYEVAKGYKKPLLCQLKESESKYEWQRKYHSVLFEDKEQAQYYLETELNKPISRRLTEEEEIEQQKWASEMEGIPFKYKNFLKSKGRLDDCRDERTREINISQYLFACEQEGWEPDIPHFLKTYYGERG